MNRSVTAPVLSTAPVRLPFAAAALLALGASSALATSCARRSAPVAPTAAISTATPARPLDDAPPTAAAGNLAQRLAGEAAARPRGGAGPRVEDVTTALQRAGLVVTSPSQVLARTIGARYCASTSTPAGLVLAVCEFADPAAAEGGLAFSRRTFDRLVPGRTLLRNRSTVLTLSGGEPSAALAADATRASNVFAAL